MQPIEEGIERLWRQANEEASSRGFLIFPGGISLEGPMAMWRPEEGIGQFLDMAVALGKRILYMRSRLLGPGELIDTVAVALSDAIDALDATTPERFLEEAGVAAEPEARDYLEFGKEHYGQRMDVNVEWVHEGIVHRFWKHSDWHRDLVDKASSVAELIESSHDEWE
jgi:hypothetical protein